MTKENSNKSSIEPDMTIISAAPIALNRDLNLDEVNFEPLG